MNSAGRATIGDEFVELDGDESEDAVDASEGLRCDRCECHFSTAGKSMAQGPSSCGQLLK